MTPSFFVSLCSLCLCGESFHLNRRELTIADRVQRAILANRLESVARTMADPHGPHARLIHSLSPNFSFEAAGKSLIRLDKAGVEVVSY